jgi:hypothetical protein
VEPLSRLVSLAAQWEFGLSDHEVTRHTHGQGLLGGRRAVHVTDLHRDIYCPLHDRTVDRVSALEPDGIFNRSDLRNVPEGLPHLFRFLARPGETAPVFVTLAITMTTVVSPSRTRPNRPVARMGRTQDLWKPRTGLVLFPVPLDLPAEIAVIEWRDS